MTKPSEAIQSTSTAEVRLNTPVVVAVPLNTMRLLDISPALPEPVQAMLETGNPVRGSKLWVRVRGHITLFSALAPPVSTP